ncbi:MAG: Lrp/AsnC family transcriptional regulator [Pseudonocardiales bacterium]
MSFVSVKLDELDRRLVAALQVSPRASWGQIARALAEQERTVARRLQRLLASDAVRVTAVHDDLRCGLGNPVHVQVRVDPGATDRVGEALATRPDTRGVFAVTSTADIWCELVAPSKEQLHDILTREIPRTVGVRDTRTQAVLRTFITVAEWHAPYLSDEEVAALVGTTVAPLPAPPERVTLTPVEQKVASLLVADGRATFTDLAAALGVSVPTARRWVTSLSERRLLHLRAEVSPALLGLPVEAQLCLVIRPTELERVGIALARHPGVRYCAATAGTYDLIVEVSVAHEGELYRFITNTIGRLSDQIDVEATLITRAYKRGHLITSRSAPEEAG